MADILGARPLFLLGSAIFTLLNLVTGFLHTGIQLIVFRALQGISLSLSLPSAVSMLSSSLQHGKWRNMGFGALGAGQPVGFAAGLTLSGVLLDTLGWRWAFWIVAIVSGLVTGAAFVALPKDTSRGKSMESAWENRLDRSSAIVYQFGTFELRYGVCSLSFSRQIIGNLLIGIVELLASLDLSGRSCRSFSQPVSRRLLALHFFTGFSVKRNSANHA
jgi:MFS family permease